MIRFLQLLTTPPNDTSITQELLSLVTGLAQNLKSLIRIGLSAALNLVRNFPPFNSIKQKKRKENNKIIYISFLFLFLFNFLKFIAFITCNLIRNENLMFKMRYLNF